MKDQREDLPYGFQILTPEEKEQKWLLACCQMGRRAEAVAMGRDATDNII